MVNYCKCGCETEIADDKTYVLGHNQRGKKPWNYGVKASDEACKKMKESAIKRFENPLERKKQSKTQLKRWEENPISNETREKQSQTMKDNFKNPDFKERHHTWYNHEDPNDGVVMLSPYSHRHGHAFLRACGVEIEHINVKEE